VEGEAPAGKASTGKKVGEVVDIRSGLARQGFKADISLSADLFHDVADARGVD
jgi:hypothetical protein